MKGVGGPNLSKKISRLLEGLNLMDVAKKPIGRYSGGMKQRVGIAQVLLNDPKVIIFDEPTVGLDPEERVRFRDLISDLANDCVVILSSHIVSDIDSIANKVAIMKDGALMAFNNPSALMALVEGMVYETILPKDELQRFKSNHLVVSTSRKGSQILVRYITTNSNQNTNPVKANLEDAYLYLTKKNQA